MTSFSSAWTIASAEPCTSALTRTWNSLRPPSFSWRHHLLERRAAGRGAACLAPLAVAIFGDLAGAGLGLDDHELIAGLRRALEKPSTSTGTEGPADFDLFAACSSTRARTRPQAQPATKMSPEPQGAALDENGGHRPAALVELGFDDDAVGRAVGIGLEIEHFGLQQDGVEELVEIGALGGRHFDLEGVAAHALDDDLMGRRSVRTRVGLACGLSILLMATMIGTSAARA